MPRVTFIHSHDDTTAFLDEIIKFLLRRGYDNFEHIKIDCAAANVDETRHIIASSDQGSTVIFLGHGASHSVYLPMIEDRAVRLFIHKDNFDILKGKNFISLSCRSADFINQNFDPEHGTAMIGFDDLPTHWHDVISEREMGNQFAFPGITDEVLGFYREMLVTVFANSLYDAISSKMDFKQFYLQLRLHTNRLMYKTTSYSISDNPTLLANMLFELKTGIRLFGNTNAPIF